MLFADMTAPIALEAKGCPEITIERVLRDIVRQLYLDNAIWIYTDLAAVIEVTGALTLALPPDSEVVAVRSLRVPDGTTYAPRTVDDAAFYDWDDSSNTIVAELGGVWTVKPAPADVITDVKVVMQVAPAYGAVEVDDRIAQRHRQLYEHATLARLLSMPSQKWTDPGLANYHATALTQLIFEAKRKADGWTTIRTPVVRYGGI